MSDVRTWRYRLPYCQKGDGGTFFIDSTGVFLAHSPYGSFGYKWTNRGGYCIRGFIAQIGADYAYGKLAHDRGGRTDVFDGERTAQAIRKFLFTDYDEDSRPAWWHDELEILEEAGQFGFDDRGAFDEWCRSTRIEEWWEFICMKPEPECWAFCTLLLPRLQARLRFDLMRETVRHIADRWERTGSIRA